MPSQSSRVPGPPDPPLVPGLIGTPSYEECAQMLAILSFYETVGWPMPAKLAWRIDPWDRRLREWGRREIERGNFDRMMEAVGAA